MSLFHRRKKFVVNEPDPFYNVIYLGNVLTVLAKGDGCTEKPLSLIWRAYCSRSRPDIPMTLSVTKSGLKGFTKQQGLTEYWAHRITYCSAPMQQYPRLFCWIYKHEGKKMKPELRCHAVLCKKLDHPQAISTLLSERITSALRDYKREKICRQNVRLCGTLAGYPTVPRRKILLSVGGHNFRPPMNRSKSAPRLHSIEECGREGDEFEEEQENLIAAIRQSQVQDVDEEETTSVAYQQNGNVDEDEETNAVNPYFVPGTPRELEFRRRLPPIVDIEIGNDLEKLCLSGTTSVCLSRQTRKSTGNLDNTEADSISDESGYHDEKSSLEEDDGVIMEHVGRFGLDHQEERQSLAECPQVTAL